MFTPTPAMLSLAESWTREVRRYVTNPTDYGRGGYSILAVKVIEGRRTVLAANHGIGVIAITTPPTADLKDHFIITINPREFTPRRYGSAALLHEIIHVCDPAFPQDCLRRCARQEAGNPIVFGSAEYYDLKSELHAYCGMWRAKRWTPVEKSLREELITHRPDYRRHICI